jgi:hypothetical protein
MQETNGQWTMKSNRGPDAMPPPPNYASDAAYYKPRDNGNAYSWAQQGNTTAGGVGGSWASSPSVAAQAREPAYQHQATPSISVTGGPAVARTGGGGGTAVSDGSYEKQLIMELCPPGGMKAEPPADKLAQFTRSVVSLNPDLVCPALLDCLEEGQPWIIRAKALWVIQTCIQHGKRPDAPNNPYLDFFHACNEEIAPLVNHARAAIREPAKRVLGLLGVATPVTGAVPVTAAVRAPAAAPPAPVPNLLDFDDTPASVPPQQAPPAPPAAGGASLFGGLNVTAGAPPIAPPPVPHAAAPTSGNLLGDMIAGDPAPAGGLSLFGDMTVKATPVPAAAPQPSPAAVSQTSSMFDNMSLKEEPKKEEAAAAMPTGSAFGFINQCTSTDTIEKKENAPASIQSMDSFDPLKNMTPNTAKQMMQLSPEQMQAMAYQQMMMQQQMHMTQMMAMQQQQQRRGSSGMFMPMPGNAPMPGHLVMQNPAAAKTSFAFMDQVPQRKDDKSFDFVKDAMSMEKKK